jgi:hypothetical protein
MLLPPAPLRNTQNICAPPEDSAKLVPRLEWLSVVLKPA